MEKLHRPFTEWVHTSDSTKHLTYKQRLALIVYAAGDVKITLWGPMARA